MNKKINNKDQKFIELLTNLVMLKGKKLKDLKEKERKELYKGLSLKEIKSMEKLEKDLF